MNPSNPKHNKDVRRRMQSRMQGADPRVPSVREQFVPSSNFGATRQVKQDYKPAPLDITIFAKTAHESTAVAAHEFHAQCGLKGAFGGCTRTERARKKAAASVVP